MKHWLGFIGFLFLGTAVFNLRMAAIDESLRRSDEQLKFAKVKHERTLRNIEIEKSFRRSIANLPKNRLYGFLLCAVDPSNGQIIYLKQVDGSR